MGPDLTTESGQFANGMHGALSNVRFEIELMEGRLQSDRPDYVHMRATYRGMLAAWRICETALVNAMSEQEQR